MDAPHEVPIPTDAGALSTDCSFGTLQAAQALGDRQALQEAGRPMVRCHLGTQVGGMAPTIQSGPRVTSARSTAAEKRGEEGPIDLLGHEKAPGHMSVSWKGSTQHKGKK